MKREEAIELKAAVGRLMYSNNKDVRDYNALIDFIESALRPVSREQVEKVCGEWLNFYNDFSTAECSKCGELFDVSDTNENLKVLFDAFKKYYRFCPSCGAPMTDEAVDIELRRWKEAVDGETD